MTYDFNLDVHYLKFDNFKQKQVASLRHILEASRLHHDMKFSNYAIISIDPEDKHAIHPHIVDIENYNRLKTNCIVYDLLKTDANKDLYHKCFIYQCNGVKGNGWYGYILWNKDTGKYVHVYHIDRDEGTLCRRLNKSIMLWRHKEKFHPFKI